MVRALHPYVGQGLQRLVNTPVPHARISHHARHRTWLNVQRKQCTLPGDTLSNRAAGHLLYHYELFFLTTTRTVAASISPIYVCACAMACMHMLGPRSLHCMLCARGFIDLLTAQSSLKFVHNAMVLANVGSIPANVSAPPLEKVNEPPADGRLIFTS